MARIRLFGHPLHPATVHAPIGLLLGVGVWDVVALFAGAAWWRLSYWTLALGVAAAALAAGTGLLDYGWLPDDEAAVRRAQTHLVVMGAAVCLYLLSLIGRSVGEGLTPPVWSVIASFAGLAALVVGGWLGADLIVRHGVGRLDEGASGSR